MALDTPARIAVLGAGPIGLEAALYGRCLGYDVDLYERGRVAEHVLRWGHVRMFTPFGRNRSTLGVAALRAQDPSWQPPPDDRPVTGREMAAAYWLPLSKSDLLADGLHEHAEVAAVTREGLLKGDLAGDETRGDGLFRLLLRDAHDRRQERTATADIVIDATGVFGQHNWLGEGGVPALGELAAEPHIEYGLPDVLGRDRDRYAGRGILVVGSGYSAATNVAVLGQLARECPDTWITWIARPALNAQSEPIPRQPPIASITNDRLVERDRIARAANALAGDEGNHFTYWPATTVDKLAWHADLDRFTVCTRGRHLAELEVDRVIANVGYHGDSGITSELQVHQCYVTGGPTRLGVELARHSGADFLDERSHGVQTLVHPEPHFYILGAKSYGRNPNFSLTVGLEQIREVFSLIGDRADLNLYATTGALA